MDIYSLRRFLYVIIMITAKQCKAARVLLNWSGTKLSAESGVDLALVGRFEKGFQKSAADKVAAMEDTFKRAGIEFLGSSGVTVKRDVSELFTGKDSCSQLWQRILQSFDGCDEGEILVTHVDERRGLKENGDKLEVYLDELKNRGITERLLSCEGDTFFLVSPKCYRWIPEILFNASRTTYIFNGCVAIQFWESDTIVYVRNQKAYEAEAKQFERLWLSSAVPKLPEIENLK